MSLKHAIYMNEMKKRHKAKEEAAKKKIGKETTTQKFANIRRHRLPR